MFLFFVVEESLSQGVVEIGGMTSRLIRQLKIKAALTKSASPKRDIYGHVISNKSLVQYITGLVSQTTFL